VFAKQFLRRDQQLADNQGAGGMISDANVDSDALAAMGALVLDAFRSWRFVHQTGVAANRARTVRPARILRRHDERDLLTWTIFLYFPFRTPFARQSSPYRSVHFIRVRRRRSTTYFFPLRQQTFSFPLLRFVRHFRSGS